MRSGSLRTTLTSRRMCELTSEARSTLVRRGLVAGLVVAAVAAGAVGCAWGDRHVVGVFGVGPASSSSEEGEAGSAINSGGLTSIECRPDVTSHSYCATSRVAPRAVPGGSVVKLAAGDVLRFPQSDGSDRVCAIGLFARDTTNAVWAVSGPSCGAGTGQALTADGYTVGEVKVVALRTDPRRSLPVVELSKNVRWSQSARSIGEAIAGAAVVSQTPHGPIEWWKAEKKLLVWDGDGVAPRMMPGDAGAPVMQGAVLVGICDRDQVMAPYDEILDVLAQLRSGANLAY